MAQTIRHEGRTVWVRLIDVPLATRLFYARVLRERDLASLPPDPGEKIAALAKALAYERAAKNPSPDVGIWVTPSKAAKVLRYEQAKAN